MLSRALAYTSPSQVVEKLIRHITEYGKIVGQDVVRVPSYLTKLNALRHIHIGHFSVVQFAYTRILVAVLPNFVAIFKRDANH